MRKRMMTMFMTDHSICGGKSCVVWLNESWNNLSLFSHVYIYIYIYTTFTLTRLFN